MLTYEKYNDVVNLFYEIQSTPELNKKKELIRKNKDNQLFVDILKFLLDTNVVTGINKKKIEKQVNYDSVNFPRLVNWYACENYLKQHNTGTKADIAAIQYFLESCEEEFGDKVSDFFFNIVTKSFKLGCNKKLVNSVISNLIPEFTIMLGASIENCKLNGDETIFITQKLNGTRCVFYNGDLYSRQGKKFTGLQRIQDQIMTLLNPNHWKDWVLDGELIYNKPKGMTDSEAFQIGTGIANSDSEDKKELIYTIFDIIPKEVFENHLKSENYHYRHIQLNSLLDEIYQNKLENLDVVPFFYSGKDHSKISYYLEYAESHDMEGVMVNLDTPYEFKRTKNLIKVKKFFDIDLKCIAVEKGEGKYQNTLGYIICEYEGNTVKCGSGFTDEQRNHFWQYSDSIVGKTVTIKYKEKTRNKDGKESLQFPVFVTVRFDK